MSQQLARFARRGVMVNSGRSKFVRGGVERISPPFARLPVPTSKLHEHDELIWDDGVAPEIAIDFDAPHLEGHQYATVVAMGLAFWVGSFGLLKLIYSEDRIQYNRRTTPRELPFNGLERELGGHAMPTHSKLMTIRANVD